MARPIQPRTMVFVPPWRQRSRLRYHVGVLPASTQRTVAEGWATYFVAAGALSTLDTALVLARGATVSVSLHYLTASVALAAWVAMPCACVFTLVVLVGRALARPAEHLPAWLRCGLVGVGGGALAGAAGLVLLRPWDLATDPYQLTALVPTACTAAGAATGLIWPRLPAPALVALLGAGALVSLAGDVFVMPGLYRTFHNLAAFLALQTAMLAAWRLRARFTVRRRLLAIVAVAAATHVAVTLDVHAVRLAAQRYGTLHDQWLAFVHRLVDLDRDGFSPLFWGGDCNDRDARIAPGRCEVPGNRIDDNCNGHTDVSGVAAPISKVPRTLRDPRPDVYVIVVDALRADLAGLGRSSHAVPALARLARSGLDFTRAYTAYPSTYRALSSVAQSRYWRYAIDPGPNLLDKLDAAGWDVQMWIRFDRLRHTRVQPVLSATRSRGDPFSLGDTSAKAEWTARIVDDAIAELRVPELATASPRFRWLHLLDTHAPLLRGPAGAAAIDRYRAEIRHLDAQLGRLLDALDGSERGLRAVVILLGDHGESFGERGGSFHGANLFDESVRVPFTMRLPGVAQRAVDTPATTIDIVPTLADYLGLADDATWQGRDWLQAPDDASGPRVLSQVESLDNWGGVGLPAMHTVHDGRYKLIVNIDENLLSLYDLDDDPAESRDLVADRPETVELLRSVSAEWLDRDACRE